MGTALSLAGALILVLANVFFVAVEFSLVASDRSEVELQAAAGDRRAIMVARSLGRLSFHLSGVQLGITVCSVGLGFVAEPSVAALLRPALEGPLSARAAEQVSLITALAIATVVQMVVGELVPKALAIARPIEIAKRSASANQWFVRGFAPIIRLFAGAADGVVRRLGIEPREELSSVRSRPELLRLVQTSRAEGTLPESEAALLSRVFRFGEKHVGDVLTPRTDIVSLSLDSTGAQLIAAAAGTGYSRFPVTGRDLDDVVGVVHVKSLLDMEARDRATATVGELMDPPLLVPETRALDELLLELREKSLVLAVVLDEYGGTAGIVSLEDLIEEILGDIDDEYDTSVAERVATGVERELRGGLQLDEVQEACGFVVPEGPYETIAGFILDRLGHLPDMGERVAHEGWTFEVTEMDRRRIARVRVIPPDEGSST